MVINRWLARTTLDVIGEGKKIYFLSASSRLTTGQRCSAAFDFQFGALDDSDNEVIQAYHNMLSVCRAFGCLSLLTSVISSVDSSLFPAAWNTLFQASWKWFPEFILHHIRYIPTREYRRIRQTLQVTDRLAKRLVDEKSEALLAGDEHSRDVMSVLGTSFSLSVKNL